MKKIFIFNGVAEFAEEDSGKALIVTIYNEKDVSDLFELGQ